MREFEIKLCSVQDVHDFVSLATSRPFTVLVSDGYRRVNGKSFMEMFSLNFTGRLLVESEGYDWEFDQFKNEAWRFLAYK